MPELPEVEAARRALEAHCVGRRITRCAVADDSKVVVVAAGRVAFERAMVGRTIVAARRRGKNLWLRLDAPPFPSFQFGMAGAIYIKGVAVTKYKRSAVNSEDEWPSKYSKFFVELDDGLEFSFTDKRRFARVRLFDDPETVPPISELGPDALFEPMSVDNFVDSLSRKKIGIKALLLDQSFISGIGNWIADEVLYQSRTHPLQIASSLTWESCEALYQSIHEVVKYAVEVDADCDRFPVEWLFHHRWGKKPGKVNGKKIEFITAGGRTTAYVPQLQKLTGTQSGKAVAANPGQVSKDGDAKEAGVEEDVEDDDELKPRKRVATFKAAKAQQNKDAISAPSRKTKKIARFYRVLPELQGMADRTLRKACLKLTRQQFYNQSHTARSQFISEHLGKPSPKHENVKSRSEMTEEQYDEVRPTWAYGKEEAWKALTARWRGEDPEFNVVSEQNKANRGSGGTHRAGNLSTDRYQAKLEAKLGRPCSKFETWDSMRMKKPDLSQPQPQLPEYYDTAQEDGAEYLKALVGFNPEVDDPRGADPDERALVVSGRGLQHGRLCVLDRVTPCTPTLSLTRVKAILTVDDPAIPPPRRPSQPSYDAAFEAAYKTFNDAYVVEDAEWLQRAQAHEEWLEAKEAADERFYATGERQEIPLTRPPRPGVRPKFVSKEEFATNFHTGTPGTGGSGTRPFGRVPPSPTLSRTITPVHPGPGASGGGGRDSCETTPAHTGGRSPSSGAGSTSATLRSPSPDFTRRDMGLSGSTPSRQQDGPPEV